MKTEIEYTDGSLLAQKIKQRDEQAYKELFDKHYGWIYRKAMRGLQNHQDAEDAVSDVFFTIWKKIDKWDDTKGNFESWLMIVVRNTIVDAIRKKRRILEIPFGTDTTSYAASVEIPIEKELVNRETEHFIEAALEKIRNRRHRLSWILHHLEFYSYPEIARILKVPVGSVKIWIFRAKSELREILAAKGYRY